MQPAPPSTPIAGDTAKPQSSFMESIKHAIQESHDAIEKTAFAEGIMNATLTLEDYTFYLRQMLAIHAPLDAYLDQTPLQDWVPATAKRTTAIQEDISFLYPAGLNAAVLPATQQIVEALKQSYVTEPLSLLGHVYILEGSRMGSRVIAKPLQRQLGIPPKALRYHLDNFETQPRVLKEFRHRLDRDIQSHHQQEAIRRAATQFMKQLLRMYRDLPKSKSVASISGAPSVLNSIGGCPFAHSLAVAHPSS